MTGTAGKISSFISFDVEALPGRSTESHVERLVWGQVSGGEFGIRRISRILNMHKIRGNFMIDFAMCALYGEKVVRTIVDFLQDEGHEIHAHLHSEWMIRKWGLNMDDDRPTFMNRTDDTLSRALMRYTAYQYSSITGADPAVFRAGGFMFGAAAVRAFKSSGFQAVSNYNSERHASSWQLPEAAQRNEPFYWPHQLLEIPVDFSPEPLSYDWNKYLGWYERASARKARKTFNLVLHSWSLLKREGEYFTAFSPDHEERLHRICDHLREKTEPLGYNQYLRRLDASEVTFPTLPSSSCSSEVLSTPTVHASCSICGHLFPIRPTSDICPGCSSRARHRQVQDVIARVGNPFDDKVVLANYANTVEVTAFLKQSRSLLNFDIRPVSEVELQMDLQNLAPLRDRTCDRFLALHVLNHVRDDERALQEIWRVLKPGGLAVLTVPYWGDETTPAADIAEHYGQQQLESFGVGTYRRYGLRDALDLFGKLFKVQTELGTDPVTGDSAQVFFLRKPASKQEISAR